MEHHCYFTYRLGGCHDDKLDLLTAILDMSLYHMHAV